MLCKQPTNTVYEENMYTTIDLSKKKHLPRKFRMKENSDKNTGQFT